jgi:hypothetical protein
MLRIRVTEDQYLRILNRSNALGYSTLSQFVRDLTLKEDLSTVKLLRDIHEAVFTGEKEDD